MINKALDALKEMEFNLAGYRKFTVMLLIIGVGSYFRYKGLVSGAELVSLFNVTASAFFASNLISKFSSKS
jgi:hypothetical protein